MRMKAPIAFSPHPQGMQGMMEKRSALAPRNKNEPKTTSGLDMKNGMETVGVGDPWSETPASRRSAAPSTSSSGGVQLHPSVTRPKSTAASSDSTPSSRPTEVDQQIRNFGATSGEDSNNSIKQLQPPGGRALTSSTRNKMDRPPATVPHRRVPSPNRIPSLQEGVPAPPTSSPKLERPKDASGLLPLAALKSQSGRRVGDSAEQEQMLFEQRLCEDALGVAVRKINQYGKANLRYVKCVNVDELDMHRSSRSISSRSAGSWGGRRKSGGASSRDTPPPSADSEKAKRALVWGKKKDVQVRLDLFTAVRKGKTTDRARRNPSPSSRVLSILTKDKNHPSLDIEAPTRMDRDKFARAFARFLDIPLDLEDSPSVHSADVTPATLRSTPDPSASSSAAGDFAMPIRETTEIPPQGRPPQDPRRSGGEQGLSEGNAGGFWQGAVAASASSAKDLSNNSDYPTSVNVDDSNRPESSNEDTGGPEAIVELKNDPAPEDEDASAVSSLTGHGYDQELVEELHQALNELRTELEESRAEAARAVKVAEQAIQSAEKSSSAEWQNTVTHKAAEAAAHAQKKSAEAMAKARLAEERLEGERRTAAFWRKQAEAAESEAGLLQTRAASAEVQRAAVEEQIESERRLATSKVDAMRSRLDTVENQQREAIDSAMDRNRTLEVELETIRREVQTRNDQGEDVENAGDFHSKNSSRRKLKIPGRKRNSDPGEFSDSKALLSTNGTASNAKASQSSSGVASTDIVRLQAEASMVRQQYELLRKTTVAELESLPSVSRAWTEQVSQTLGASQLEIARLRERLSFESASRRKLLHEVQDLRGIVRVYCRPRPASGSQSTVSTPSQETLVLHREKFGKATEGTGPMSFEFDRIFQTGASQKDVFTEVHEVCLSALDGYNVCAIAYGQTGSGKTNTILGDITTQNQEISIENHGLQLQVMKQLFTVAEHRSDRFKDVFSLTIVEVYNERLADLLASTQAAARGQVVVADSKRKSQRSLEDDTTSSRPAKLEIRTDVHGETVVQGAVSLEIESFEEAVQIWEECLANKRNRLVEQELDASEYEASSHVIATLRISSANIATGHGTIGRLQFVDLAGADLMLKYESPGNEGDSAPKGIGNNSDYRFVHRSLETLGEVATARSQFVRSVPYRNSTITHLLRDSLEADTKVLLFACISSDVKDMQETAQALRFAHRMRQVNVGKATKHSITSP